MSTYPTPPPQGSPWISSTPPQHNTSTPPVPPPKPTPNDAHPSSASPPPVPPPPRRSSRMPPAAYLETTPGFGADQQWDQGGGWDAQRAEAPVYEVGYGSEQGGYQATRDEPQMPQEGWVPDILLDKSKQDLHHLLDNPALLASLLHHPDHAPKILTASSTPLQAQLGANASLAQTLSSLERELAQLRETTSAHVLSTRGLESNWRKKQKEMENKLEAWGPRELYNRLGAAIQEGEGTCRALEEGVLEDDAKGVMSEREVADWVRRVREGRRVVGLRRERRARWDEGRVGGWR